MFDDVYDGKGLRRFAVPCKPSLTITDRHAHQIRRFRKKEGAQRPEGRPDRRRPRAFQENRRREPQTRRQRRGGHARENEAQGIVSAAAFRQPGSGSDEGRKRQADPPRAFRARLGRAGAIHGSRREKTRQEGHRVARKIPRGDGQKSGGHKEAGESREDEDRRKKPAAKVAKNPDPSFIAMATQRQNRRETDKTAAKSPRNRRPSPQDRCLHQARTAREAEG